MGPLTRVTPFTHRDNATFLSILSELIKYVNSVQNESLNASLQAMLDRYQELVDEYALDVTTTKDAWITRFDEFMADLTAQIALINDSAIAGLIGDVESATRQALDARYATVEELLREIDEITTAANAGYGYLFANFTYNSPEGEKLNLFFSGDGKTTTGHGPNPIYAPASGVRDPSIVRIGTTWFMTHGHTDPTLRRISVARSEDLLNWTQIAELDLSPATGLTRAWAPELVIDTSGDAYIFFTNVVNEGVGHECWYVKATNNSLSAWGSPLKLQWTVQPGRVMDMFPVRDGNRWVAFYGDNSFICRATADNLLGPWTADKTGDWAGWGPNKEAPALVKVSENLWRLYIDRYEGSAPNWTYPGYAYTESTDLLNWTGLTPVKMGVDAQGIVLRHGSMIKIQDSLAAAQVSGVMFAGGGAQRYLEGTTGKMIPSGQEVNIGAITIDGGGEQRSLVTSDFSFPADGRIKTGSTGTYSFDLHAGDDSVNNFKDTGTKWWATIYCVTRGRTLARTQGVGGYEGTASVSNVRCNAGEIMEFRVFHNAPTQLPIDCTVRATRIN